MQSMYSTAPINWASRIRVNSAWRPSVFRICDHRSEKLTITKPPWFSDFFAMTTVLWKIPFVRKHYSTPIEANWTISTSTNTSTWDENFRKSNSVSELAVVRRRRKRTMKLTEFVQKININATNPKTKSDFNIYLFFIFLVLLFIFGQNFS